MIALAAAAPVLVAVLWPGRRRAALTALAVLAVASGVGLVALVRSEADAPGPVATAAHQRALVTLTGTVASDPRRIEGAASADLACWCGSRWDGTSPSWCSATTPGSGSPSGNGSASPGGWRPSRTRVTWPPR